MDALRLQPDVPNIPYMHLFHDLKQKFPFLKDSEINESIQKYGLDRDRCIEELSQRHVIPPGGYYGPWGRGSSGSGFSSPSLSRVTSPLRGGTPTTPTTSILTTASNMMPQLHHTAATHLVLHPQSSGFVAFSPSSSGPTYTSPKIITSPTSYHPPLGHPYGWTSVVSNGPCLPDMPTESLASGSNQDTPFSSRDSSRSPTPARSHSPSPSPLPSSAPVLITNFDPFCDYKNYDIRTPHRRKSVETVYDKKHGLYYNIQNFEQVRRLSLSPVRSQCSPLSDVHDLSSPSSPTTATVTTTTTTAAAETIGSQASGQKHVSRIHMIPTPPHVAHHNPGPCTEDGEVSVSVRSYTSVNLQLRQPSSEPQSPIQIRGSGSSLTYSTSSLDHRLGARSSLQISIGPNGGTISAMRTNKDTNSPANTAFHIQYTSGANESSVSPTAEVFQNSEEQAVGREVPKSNSRRPQTWYVPDNQEVPEQRSRKSSLPESGELPLLNDFQYPPSSSELAYEGGVSPAAAYPSSGLRLVGPPTSTEPDPFITQAIVQEQSTRKKRLEEELNKSVEERNELEDQVVKMKRDLEAREHQRHLNADANSLKIEDVQFENQRLQSECDQMESEILRIAPLTDTDEYLELGKSSHVTTPVYESLSLPTSGLGPSQLTGGGSVNNVHSNAGSPMTAHAPMIPGAGFTPTRPAPPPPQPTSFNYPHTQGVLNNDESERNWSCSKCTFINHPGLNKCEMCEFPRFNIGRESSSDMMVVDVPSLAPPEAEASGLQPHSHQGPCYCHRSSSHHTQAGSQDYHD